LRSLQRDTWFRLRSTVRTRRPSRCSCRNRRVIPPVSGHSRGGRRAVRYVEMIIAIAWKYVDRRHLTDHSDNQRVLEGVLRCLFTESIYLQERTSWPTVGRWNTTMTPPRLQRRKLCGQNIPGSKSGAADEWSGGGSRRKTPTERDPAAREDFRHPGF